MESENTVESPALSRETASESVMSESATTQQASTSSSPSSLQSAENFRSPLPAATADVFQKPDELPKPSSSKQVKIPANAPLNYKEPEWASLPAAGLYSLEILKNGVVVGQIPLSGGKSYFTVGRLPGQCDICSEHPSSSRFHAIFQHGRKNASDTSDGFYLYDLNSTHGTFLNKTQLEPATYVRLHVGHVVKFGSSTRFYVLEGPEEDVEEESSLTVSQIRQLQAKKLEMALKKSKGSEKVEEDKGIDWGFGEDAVDEEGEGEEGKDVGVFGSISSHDAFYADDPKKALNAFYLREGMDMESDIEEIGHGNKKQYHCRIALPIDAPNGRQLIADAVANRKKDAFSQAVLEACRLLHAQGALKNTTSIGKKYGKRKNWQEEDFYDSEDDVFVDRTGSIEKKRQKRIQRSAKNTKNNNTKNTKNNNEEKTSETFESLTFRLEVLKNEVEEISKKLQLAEKQKTESIGGGALDDLDVFMEAIKNGFIMDVKTKIKLKQRLTELKQEEIRLIQIINLVKPLNVQPIQPTLWTGTVAPVVPVAPVAVVPITRLKTPALPAPVARVYDHNDKSKFVAEEDEEEDTAEETSATGGATTVVGTGGATVAASGDSAQPVSSDGVVVDRDSTRVETVSEVRRSTVKRPLREEDASKSDSTAEGEHSQKGEQGEQGEQGEKGEKGELPPAVETSVSRPYVQTAQPKKRRQDKQQKVEYDPSDPDYAMWIPPEDQAGDGKTTLNDRLGY